MIEQVRVAIRTGPRNIELRTLEAPPVSDDSALLRMEVAGVCGTDVKMYNRPPSDEPVIMGHENIGLIAEAGSKFLERHGVEIGDRVFIEHYVACYQCEWCRGGQYQHCEATDWRTNSEARRYGYTSAAHPYRLWGGFAEYMYLPWNAVVHKVPETISPELAGLVTPLSNGIEWALFDAGIGFGDSVLIQGPGQQGLSQVVACKQAGASNIIVTGTSRDHSRLEIARRLGADHVVDVNAEDAALRVQELTDGVGVDYVLDCTAGAGRIPVLLGIEALKRRGGTLLLQGEIVAFSDFPLKLMTEKAITIRSARGHSYRACELALQQLASRRFPLEALATHRFPLAEVETALRAMGGETDDDVIHVSILPNGPV